MVKSKVRKRFEREMFIRTLPTILLEIFCKINLNVKEFVKSIKDTDDNLVNGLSIVSYDDACSPVAHLACYCYTSLLIIRQMARLDLFPPTTIKEASQLNTACTVPDRLHLETA